MPYDAFISHATEDKERVGRPLADRLTELGYSIWFDEAQLKAGDSLRRHIDRGLAKSRFGIIILSPSFLRKNWTQYELDGLVARENQIGTKVILPVWHGLSRAALCKYAPTLADRVAAITASGMSTVTAFLADAMGRPQNLKLPRLPRGKTRRSKLVPHKYTLDLYNEWHGAQFRRSRRYVSKWTEKHAASDSPLPSLSVIERGGGAKENHVFQIIHFFERWALLARNGILDCDLMVRLLASYLVWYETNLIDPLIRSDERNQDFKNLLRLIKHEVFTEAIYRHGQLWVSNREGFSEP